MTFNQDLITKARKGEIAILNDGTREETNRLLRAIWPKDYIASENALATYKLFEARLPGSDDYHFLFGTDLPTHSVKDFIMNTTDSETLHNTVQQPRTYRVTRQQMKEIWKNHPDTPDLILQIAGAWFGAFDDEVKVDDVQLSDLLDCYNQPYPEILLKTFPSYFYIPEGEPVLCRREVGLNWFARVSDGKGGVYFECNLEDGLLSEKYHYIIPFTKNPPK